MCILVRIQNRSLVGVVRHVAIGEVEHIDLKFGMVTYACVQKHLRFINFKNIYIGFVGLHLFSCSHSSQSSSYEISSDENSEWEIGDDDDEQVAQMVTCPMCNGTGIFDFMPGDVMAPKQTCTGCDGQGVCDASTARTIMQAKKDVDALMGVGSGAYDTYDSGGSGRDANQIQYELNKAYELLESMEEAYANSDGIVVSSQYPQMIASQKERIRQLEEELMYAQ